VSSAQSEQVAVRKSIVVQCDVERAFDVFTRQIGTWWPTHTHSIGGDKITEVVVDEHVGGRVYEKHSDGGEGEWGKVLVWEPPAKFAMTWYPGHDDTRATRLDVTFTADGDTTRVDLEHTGWEIFAEQAPEHSKAYDDGWGTVLGYYTRLFD